MNTKKSYIFLIILILTTSAGSLLLHFSDSVESEESEKTKFPITDMSVADIQAVVLKNDSGSIGLLNLPDGIVVDGENEPSTDNKNIPVYDQSKLISLIYTLSHLSADHIVQEPEQDMVYGFSEPLAQTRILLNDHVIRLNLGRKSPISDEYYLRSEGDPSLYLISAQDADYMLQSVSDLRDLSLFPVLNSESIKTLSKITVSSSQGAFTLEQIANDTISSFFRMTAPVESSLDWKNVDDLILNPLRNFTPTHFVSDQKELSFFGLDTPEYIMELVISGEIWRCGFSRKDPDTWYCANLDRMLVSEIPVTQTPFLQTDFMDLIGNSIYTVAAADLSFLSAKFQNQTISLEISGEAALLTGSINNTQLDYMELLAFYQKIDSIPAAAIFYEDQLQIRSDPLLTLVFSQRNGQEDILEFYPISDRQCAVFINSVCEFTTYLTVVNDLIDAFQTLNKSTS